MLKNQGALERNEFGAARESNKGRGRFDLFPYEAMEALAVWYEQGGEKYGDRNWEKGLDIDDTLNRMTRHAIKACNGWTDEDHLSAVMWNAAAVITLRARAAKSAKEIMEHPTIKGISMEEFLQLKKDQDEEAALDKRAFEIYQFKAAERKIVEDREAEAKLVDNIEDPEYLKQLSAFCAAKIAEKRGNNF